MLGFSIVAKETLYRVTKRIGEKNNSSVLVANAYHHRSDVWASVVALAGLGGAYMGYVCERLHEERFVAGSRGRHRGGRIDREDGSGLLSGNYYNLMDRQDLTENEGMIAHRGFFGGL